MSDPLTMNAEQRFAERRALFQHEPPEGYADEMAELLARVPDADSISVANMLLFRVAYLTLAISPVSLASVSRGLQPYPLPHRRSGPVLGLVAFQGEVIPCCSIVRLMGVADAVAQGSMARTLILTDDRSERWAVPVDEVLGISTGAVRQQGEVSEWTEGVFDDDHGTVAKVLRLNILVERMRRAIA